MKNLFWLLPFFAASLFAQWDWKNEASLKQVDSSCIVSLNCKSGAAKDDTFYPVGTGYSYLPPANSCLVLSNRFAVANDSTFCQINTPRFTNCTLNYTVETWIFQTNNFSTLSYPAFSAIGVVGGTVYFGQNNANTARVGVRINGVGVGATVTPVVGKWTHYICVWRGGTNQECYVNGALGIVSTISTQSLNWSSFANSNIWCSLSGGCLWYSTIMNHYNRALSPAEILQRYEEGKANP